jgi:Copper amine oxidase N-terminal domain.
MKKHFTGFIVGICAAVLAMMLVIPAFADGEFSFNRVIISVNGEQKAGLTENYTLDNGTQVPFSILYQQTTYLPVRKLSELTGLGITWEQATSTVQVTTETGETVGIEFYQRALAKNAELQAEINRLQDENTSLKAVIVGFTGAVSP